MSVYVENGKIVAGLGGVPDALKPRQPQAFEWQSGAAFMVQLTPAMVSPENQGPLANIQQVQVVAAALLQDLGEVQAFAVANWLGGLGGTSVPPSSMVLLGSATAGVVGVAALKVGAASAAGAAAAATAGAAGALVVAIPVGVGLTIAAVVGGLAYFGSLAYEKFKPDQYLDVDELSDMTAGYPVKIGGALVALKKRNPIAHEWVIRKGFAKALRKTGVVVENTKQDQQKALEVFGNAVEKITEAAKNVLNAAPEGILNISKILADLMRNVVPITLGIGAVWLYFQWRGSQRRS